MIIIDDDYDGRKRKRRTKETKRKKNKIIFLIQNTKKMILNMSPFPFIICKNYDYYHYIIVLPMMMMMIMAFKYVNEWRKKMAEILNWNFIIFLFPFSWFYTQLFFCSGAQKAKKKMDGKQMKINFFLLFLSIVSFSLYHNENVYWSIFGCY